MSVDTLKSLPLIDQTPAILTPEEAVDHIRRKRTGKRGNVVAFAQRMVLRLVGPERVTQMARRTLVEEADVIIRAKEPGLLFRNRRVLKQAVAAVRHGHKKPEAFLARANISQDEVATLRKEKQLSFRRSLIGLGMAAVTAFLSEGVGRDVINSAEHVVVRPPARTAKALGVANTLSDIKVRDPQPTPSQPEKPKFVRSKIGHIEYMVTGGLPSLRDEVDYILSVSGENYSQQTLAMYNGIKDWDNVEPGRRIKYSICPDENGYAVNYGDTAGSIEQKLHLEDGTVRRLNEAGIFAGTCIFTAPSTN